MTAPAPESPVGALAPAVTWWRKRPVTVPMILWTGDNEEAVHAFAGSWFHTVDPEDAANSEDPEITAEVWDKLHSTWVGVKTGQRIVKGVKGELYPIDPAALCESYDPADSPEAEAETPGEAYWDAYVAADSAYTEKVPFGRLHADVRAAMTAGARAVVTRYTSRYLAEITRLRLALRDVAAACEGDAPGSTAAIARETALMALGEATAPARTETEVKTSTRK